MYIYAHFTHIYAICTHINAKLYILNKYFSKIINISSKNKLKKTNTRGTLYIFGDFPNFDLNKLHSGGNQSKAPYYQHVLGGWILQSPEYAGLRLHADPNHVRKRNFAKIKVIRQGGYIFYIL